MSEHQTIIQRMTRLIMTILIILISTIMTGTHAAIIPPNSAQTSQLKGPYLGQNPPGETPELFAPGVVSTCNQHSSVYFTPDGREAYFSRLMPLPHLIVYMHEDIEGGGGWTSPSIVCEGLTPGLAPDGKTVLFSTWELWRTIKTTSGWTEPENLGPSINFQERQDAPSAAADGTLYYCSMRENGIYGKPERLEYGISSDYSDFSPYIAPDESYLIFASTRPGFGITDLYISFRNDDGSWTTPKNMGRTINTGAKEAFPFVSFDGKYLFFMSNRVSELNQSRIPDGPGNVFWVDASIIEGYR
jgi:hypothetical protein